MLVALLAAFIVSAAAASTEARAPTVSVFFLRGEQLALTQRVASTPADAVRELLAGPPRVADVSVTVTVTVPETSEALSNALEATLAERIAARSLDEPTKLHLHCTE